MQALKILRFLVLMHAPRVIGAAAAEDLRDDCTCESTRFRQPCPSGYRKRTAGEPVC
jgi:hypothetical protein